MRLKKGVIAEGVQAQTWYAIGVAEVVYRDLNTQLVVTSLKEGEHKEGSLHYLGLACDLRTRDLSRPGRQAALSRLVALLDPQGYDVIEEASHFHIEYDPKKGEQWLIRVG